MGVANRSESHNYIIKYRPGDEAAEVGNQKFIFVFSQAIIYFNE